MALAKQSPYFTHVLSQHETPMRRATIPYTEEIQKGKENNVALAGNLIDGIVIQPSQTFSWHHAVGPTIEKRGFLLGPEMHGGKLEDGWGGGCCSVSNMLYLIALQAGLTITERHRHGLDLFPDHGRTVPFACGATVFYTQADLRFMNPHNFPVQLKLWVEENKLTGQILCESDPGTRYEIYEAEHNFHRESEVTVRENRIRRRQLDSTGSVVADVEVAHNVARVLYELDEVPL